jgi:hypothetical protein
MPSPRPGIGAKPAPVRNVNKNIVLGVCIMRMASRFCLVKKPEDGKIEAWRRDYNEERPHSSLGYLAPQRFAQLAQSGAQA